MTRIRGTDDQLKSNAIRGEYPRSRHGSKDKIHGEVRAMEVGLLVLIGLVTVLFFLGICVAAHEQQRARRTQDKGDAYRLRDQSTRHTLN